MLKPKYKWQKLNEDTISTLDDLHKKLLINRHIDEDLAEKFFSKEIHFYDPFLFTDMMKASERIKRAVKNKEKVMIYGDYDVDGITGTAILSKTLQELGLNADYYIPDRFTEGYGPNLERFKIFVQAGYTLIITVDNGITGISEAQYLKETGVDLIITDHHEFKDEIPEAYAVIHPRLDHAYPFKDLSGSGTAFKLSQALLGRVPLDYVDLAALGTYSDIVSLLDENREILKAGLARLENSKHLGLRLLLQEAGVTKMTEDTIGFVIGPRLNAPGRMGDGNTAVKLLVTEHVAEAKQLVKAISEQNEARRAQIDLIFTEAKAQIAENGYDKDHVIMVCKEDWHEGVIGIIANRLVEEYDKPVIVFTESENLYKGSARTLPDFPLFENLDKCQDLLYKYGGHKMAAGLSIEKDRLELLRKRLHDLANSEFENSVFIDGEISPKLIDNILLTKLEMFRPFGVNNAKPLFSFSDYEIESLSLIGNNKHLRFVLKKDGVLLTAVAFRKANLYDELAEGDIISVVGNLESNEYNNRTTVQLLVKDIRCDKKQLFDFRSRAINEQLSLQYLYFTENYGYNNANQYIQTMELKENVALIDLPDSPEQLKEICNNPKVGRLYFLFRCHDIFAEEDLLTREKLGKVYQLLKKQKEFSLNNSKIPELLKSYGINKKTYLLIIQVFFELNFVIINDNNVLFVDNPEKRNLSDSLTFRHIEQRIFLKDKLLLSSSKELKAYINNL